MTMVALSIAWPGAVTTRAFTSAWYPVPLSRMPSTGSVRVACWALALADNSKPRLSDVMKAFTAVPWIGGKSRLDSRRVQNGSVGGAKAKQLSSLSVQEFEGSNCPGPGLPGGPLLPAPARVMLAICLTDSGQLQ